MKLPYSTPAALAADPELAALEILGAAATTARRALLAHNPEIDRGDFFRNPRASGRQCLAICLILSLDTLDGYIENYRELLENLAAASKGYTDADIPF